MSDFELIDCACPDPERCQDGCILRPQYQSAMRFRTDIPYMNIAIVAGEKCTIEEGCSNITVIGNGLFVQPKESDLFVFGDTENHVAIRFDGSVSVVGDVRMAVDILRAALGVRLPPQISPSPSLAERQQPS